MLEVSVVGNGVTVWRRKTGGKAWIIDGSTIFKDGWVTIDMSMFNIKIDAGENKMTLKYKDSTLHAAIKGEEDEKP